MSRIAKDPVNIPDGVTVASENNTINFKGPKGELSLDIHESVSFAIEDNAVQVKWSSDAEKAMAGTMRALINNYMIGVSEGYTKNIKLNGVGYRANVQGKKIVLTLGFSHPVEYNLPEEWMLNQKTKQNLMFHQIINRFWAKYVQRLDHSGLQNHTKEKVYLLMESMW